ncbi:ketopantoate reductase family protein [Paenibacillus sp. NEAU-GSW1]|uniref:ketopantoate reductase family protein n=1 Tax=Paenibacillus sp. NEAU-GSW1 TaxID=2682486 RepID=UPI001565F73A|nr:2-dehydropantoate 2-reductase [Paenibacillus sp. NEAU-GSW1]
MKIDVIGGGAIGLLHAAKLAMAGSEVTVWTRTESQAKALNKCGIAIRDEHHAANVAKVQSAPLHSLREPQSGKGTQWMLLTVKQSDIDDRLLQGISLLAGDGGRLLCMQNGVGHLDKLAQALPRSVIYAGVTTEGAKRIDAASIDHTGQGQLFWGPMTAIDDSNNEIELFSQKLLSEALEAAGFHSLLSKDMKNRIYQKLLVNAVINPLTALFGVTNGQLPHDLTRKQLMAALYKETAAILQADGMPPVTDGWQRVLDVCSATEGNVSSMLADVRAGRVTEIEWINGGVCAIARSVGLASPLNDAVCAMIGGLKRQSDGDYHNDDYYNS